MSDKYRDGFTWIMKSLMVLLLLLVAGKIPVFAQEGADEQSTLAEEDAERKGYTLLWGNDNGNKHGWVLEYLSAGLKVVPREQSCYYRYTFFCDGISYDPVIMKGSDYIIKSSGLAEVPLTGSPEPLEGRFAIYGSNGSLLFEVIYNEGYRTGVHRIYRDGRVQYEVDFDRKPDRHQNYGYFLTGFNMDGSVKCQEYYDYRTYLRGSSCYVIAQ